MLTLRIPLAPAAGLDYSWQLALSWAWEHSLQSGKDIVFTYGPAGFLENLVQLPKAFPYQLLWIFCTRSAVAFLTVSLLKNISPRALVYKATAIVLILVPAGESQGIIDAYYAFAIIVATARLLSATARLEKILAGCLLMSFALVKFSATVEVTWALTLVSVELFRRSERRDAAIVVGLPIIFAASFWLLLRQNLFALPQYVSNSWQVADGYVDAMGSEFKVGKIFPALAALLVFLVSLARRCRQCQWSGRFIALVLVTLGCTYMLWRHGTIRSDRWHLPGLFAFLSSVTLVFPELLIIRSDRGETGGFSPIERLSIGLCLAGLVAIYPKPYFKNLKGAFRETSTVLAWMGAPTVSYQDWKQTAQTSLDRLEIPELQRAIVGKEIYFSGNSQETAIANISRLQFSPVLQAYCAYTPALQNLNAAALNSFDPAGLVLYQDGTIDDRYPTIDSSGTLDALLTGFTPVFRMRDFTLYSKNGNAVARTTEPGFYLRWEEWHNLDNYGTTLLQASINIALSPLGKVFRFFLPIPQPSIEIECADGSLHRYDLPWRAGRRGFILSPYNSIPSEISLSAPQSAQESVKRFRIISSGEGFFSDSAAVILSRTGKK